MNPASDSHQLTREKFDSADYAALYSRKFARTRKDAREKACVAELLAGLPPGSRVLDLPCGAGRLMPFLAGLGHRLSGADVSDHMLEQARKRLDAELGEAGAAIDLSRQDVLALGYADGTFDAVVSNRLFHHFSEPDTRRRALAELSRVCKGPLVVSFFCSATLGAWKRRIVNAIKGVTPVDRIPIPLAAFGADAEAAGLRVERVLPVRRGISPQTYVRLVRAGR